VPLLVSYYVRSRWFGPDRALEGSTQLLALIPGLSGQYLRRAFLTRVLTRCHWSATIEFGTILSKAGAEIDENVYVGPGCVLGLVHIERDVMLAAGVHVPSGSRTHGIDDLGIPMREQPGTRTLVRIGEGAWIGSAAVVMADVGAGTIVGAGAVVTKPLPPQVVAGGIPARILRSRADSVNTVVSERHVG
jgi:virginiamycin A acetyltransferase